MPTSEGIYQLKRQKMLSKKIDLTEFLIWLFENYPNSISDYEKNPNIQNRFK
mgnify:CR=1 FL=1